MKNQSSQNRQLKLFVWSFIFLFSCFQIFKLKAQAPQAIPYQAVARNNTGSVISNQTIAIRFTIHNTAANGPMLYQETQSTSTNSLGLFNVYIGQGTPTLGLFSGINWTVGTKYVEVEIDPNGSNNYSNLGTIQLMSVPYALYANSAANFQSGTQTGNTPYWNGTNWVHNSSNLFNNGGNIGIGTTTPTSKLYIEDSNGGANFDALTLAGHGSGLTYLNIYGGNAVDNSGSIIRLITKNVTDTATTSVDLVKLNNGGFFINNYETSSTAHTSFSIGTSERMRITSSGNIGIGTSNPTAKLDVAGQVKISGGSPGTGKVLTSDANGLATWEGEVGFEANTSDNVFLPPGIDSTRIYTNVVWNTNGVYNPANGAFTAPSNGLYHFDCAQGVYATPPNGPDGWTYLSLKVNGVSRYVATTRGNPTAGWNFQGSFTTRLNAGDMVTVGVLHVGSSYSMQTKPDSDLSYFSGFKVK